MAAFRATLGVPSDVYYPNAVPDYPPYRRFARDACVAAQAWARECVSLPCNPFMTESEVDAVAEALAGTVEP